MQRKSIITPDEGYIAMASDNLREAEAAEWCNALARDMANESRLWTCGDNDKPFRRQI